MKPLYYRDKKSFLQDNKIVEKCTSINAAKRRSRELQKSGATVLRSK